jgi:DNA-binding PadR family transcriptional regulator
MLDELESTLLRILKTFSPRERELLSYGGSYWSVLHSIVHFRENKFTLDDLLKYVHTRERRERIDTSDLPLILKRLEENDLIIKDVKGFYEIPSTSLEALHEAFGFIWRPRQGKTGFLKYMLGSEKRVTLWYCLHQRGLLSPEQAQEITGYDLESCKKYMKKFLEQELLTEVEKNVYRLGDEQKIHEIFRKLFEGYLNYAIPRPSTRDTIINIMQGHDKASGKEIHRDLKKMGKTLDISGIYRALHGLEAESIVRKTGETRRVRGTLMEYYELNYEDPQKYTEQLKSMIQEKIRKSELKNSVREELFKEIVKQKPHVAYVFFKDLDPLVLWYENQIESLTLWEEFIKNLPQNLINGVITEFSSGKSDEEFKERLAGISRRFRISPLVIAMIYLFEVTTRKKTNV